MNIPKLKGVMVEKGIDRNELCFIWNCSLKTVSNKLTGKTPITLEEAKRFSAAAELSDEDKFKIFLAD